MRRLVPIAAVLAAACALPGAPDDALVADARMHVSVLSSDYFRGRDSARPEGRLTADYVADAFARAGLEPTADGDFLQRFPLLGTTLRADEAEVAMRGVQPPLVWSLGEDVALGGYGQGVSLEAPVVFAGHGISAHWAGVDDYAALDVEGAFVVVLEGRPDGRDDLVAAANRREKADVARARGAVGMVRVLDRREPRDERTWGWVVRGADRTRWDLPAEERDAFPMVYMDLTAAGALFAAADRDLSAAREARAATAGLGGFPLEGISLRVHAPGDVVETDGYNVAALLPGGDPALADEVVVVTAHMDHVGVDDDGRVHHGADDNASGTTAILLAAERLAAGPPPRRSVLFLAVGAEEKGLLGSEWWVAHPTLPLERVVANVNIDMVGRNDPRSIGATPSPTHPAYNTLVERARALAPRAGLRLEWESGEGGYERPVDELYHRSDHVNFARAGVPVVFFFSGLHEDYHRPTDTADKLDYEKVARVTRLVADLARDVADAAERPRTLGVPNSAGSEAVD